MTDTTTSERRAEECNSCSETKRILEEQNETLENLRRHNDNLRTNLDNLCREKDDLCKNLKRDNAEIKCMYCEDTHKSIKDCRKCVLDYQSLSEIKKLVPGKIITKFHLVLLAFYISTIRQTDNLAVTISMESIPAEVGTFSIDQLYAYGNASDFFVSSVTNAVMWNCHIDSGKKHLFQSIYKAVIGVFISIYLIGCIENISYSLLLIRKQTDLFPILFGGPLLSLGVVMLILSHNISPVICTIQDSSAPIYNSTTQKVDFQFQERTTNIQKVFSVTASILIILWLVVRLILIMIYDKLYESDSKICTCLRSFFCCS